MSLKDRNDAKTENNEIYPQMPPPVIGVESLPSAVSFFNGDNIFIENKLCVLLNELC